MVELPGGDDAPGKVQNLSRSDTDGSVAIEREADHRIANSIQIAAATLRHETRRIENVGDARAALERAASRLLAIGRLHRQLSWTAPGRTVDLAQFLTPFCDDTAFSTGARIELHADDIVVPTNFATQLCTVLSEVAMNAIKHGADDTTRMTVTVEVRRNGMDGLRMTIRDDGCGLPRGFSMQEATGLGMTIITATVTKLGGQLEVLADGGGAGFQIDVPLPRQTERRIKRESQALD